MDLQYLLDEKGNTTAVVVPIEEWKRITVKYPELGSLDNDVPTWQKEEVLKRKNYYEEHPQELLTWEEARQRLNK